MSKKADIDHFLKKELKALADSRGDVSIPEQATFDESKANTIKVKDKKIE